MSAFDLGDAVWVKGGGCIACCFVTGYGCGLNCEKLHPEEDGHYIRPPAPPADKTTERPAAPSPVALDGINLRDWFAGMAMQGLLARSLDGRGDVWVWTAKKAYEQADAMMKARKKEG